jgi:two-component system, OmpR family, response regulator QseB
VVSNAEVSIERRTVLVIEDDAATNAMVAAALTDEGYVVIAAHDGDEGIRQALLHAPALILLDLRMPRGGGVDFLEAYRAKSPNGAAIVLMTAAADQDHEDVRSMVDGVLPKPFDIDDLIEVTLQHCG